MRSVPRLAALVALTALAALPGRAQVVTLDEGSFTVTRAGARIGREEFRIVRQPSGGGVEYVARALAAYGDRRVAPALQTDGDGAPLRYQVEVRAAGGVEERLSGQASGSRFRVQARTARGEAAREYRLAPGTLLVEDDLFHQWFQLALGGRATRGEVAILAPRRNLHGTATVTRVGDEAVVIGGRSLPAVRLAVLAPGTGRHDVWLDAEGRVLRVAIAADGVVAVRDDPPAER